MNHDPKVCFHDIKFACEQIIEFVGVMSLAEYLDDAKTRSAVERQFEIIGEALNRIKKLDTELLKGVTSWQPVIGFRNILAHCYNNTNDEAVYGFAVEDVHTLLQDVERKLKN